MKKKGQDITEWALVLTFIAVLSIMVWFTVVDKLKAVGNSVTTTLSSANNSSMCESSGGAWDTATKTCACPGNAAAGVDGKCP